MRFLITAGPTQEPIDDVRYITNPSSGKMGVALAEEALGRGHSVTLVCGPINVDTPDDAVVFRVRTADEMIDKTLEIASEHDVLISAAAIADYRPKKKDGKIKSGKPLVIKLTPTRKLTRLARSMFPKLFVVAFKAEHGVSGGNLVDIARKKLLEENLDLIIANDVSKGVFGSDENEVHIVGKTDVLRIRRMSKKKIAGEVIKTIEERLGAKHVSE